MKDRGKRELEPYINGVDDLDTNAYEFPCKKHPSSSSSSSGICAYCLTDRLVQLVCPECGAQRLSSCSCSEDNSSNPNDAVNGPRISLLLESEKPENQASKGGIRTELKRSNSTCVADVGSRGGRRERESGKEGNSGFWKLGKLFRKKKEKKIGGGGQNDEIKSEMAASECIGVSRSRSLCSFRGFYDTEESGNFNMSSSAARASSVSGNFVLDSAKRSCFSESEARISNFDYNEAFNFGANYSNINVNNNNVINGNGYNKSTNSIFSWKESEFVGDDPAFIDLRLHETTSSEMPSRPPEVLRRGGLGMSAKEFGFRGGEEMFKNGRISVSERELRKCRKSYKVWKWFFRQQSGSRRKEEEFEDHAFKY